MKTQAVIRPKRIAPASPVGRFKILVLPVLKSVAEAGEQSLDFGTLGGLRRKATEEFLGLAGGVTPATRARVRDRETEAGLVEIGIE